MGYSGLDIPSWAPHTPRDSWHPKKGGLNILLLVPYIPRARYCSPGSPNNQVWIIQSWLLIHPGLNIPVMVPFTSRARYSHPGSLYTHGRILQYLAPYTPRVRYSSLGSTYNWGEIFQPWLDIHPGLDIQFLTLHTHRVGYSSPVSPCS